MVFVAFFFIMTSFCVCLCPTQTCYKCKAQASYFARLSPSLTQLRNQRERDIYAHVFNTRRKRVPEGCITLCTLNGYIHDTSVWHLLYTCCCCVQLCQYGPHCKRQVNASKRCFLLKISSLIPLFFLFFVQRYKVCKSIANYQKVHLGPFAYMWQMQVILISLICLSTCRFQIYSKTSSLNRIH